MFTSDVLAQKTYKDYVITAYRHEPLTFGFKREIVYNVRRKGKLVDNCKYPKQVGVIGWKMVEDLEKSEQSPTLPITPTRLAIL